MRIALLTYEFPDVRPGGVGSFIPRLTRSLLACQHEVHIFTLTLPPDVRAALPGDFIVHDLPGITERIVGGNLPAPLGASALQGGTAVYKLALASILADALRRQHHITPFDIVEAAECEALGIPLILQPIPDLPVVTHIHLNSAVNRWANQSPVQAEDHITNALEFASILGADGLCAPTQNVVDLTRKLMPFDRDVTIIPHPVVPDPDARETPEDGPLLFLGRLQKRKGCDILASAASIFLKKHPRATLRIAGADTPTGPNTSGGWGVVGGGEAAGTSMQAEMIRRLDPAVRERAVFLGEIPQRQVRAEIQACLFQIVPSTVENFANTATEAMAAGRALVYGGNTGLDEVVGDAGLRVWPLEPENLARQMDRLYTDRQLLRTCAHRGLERIATRFSFETVTRQRMTFYQATIDATPRGPRAPRVEHFKCLSSDQIGAVFSALNTVLHACAGVPAAVPTPGRLTLQLLKDLGKKLQRAPVVWLFGGGRYTIRLLAERYLWESEGLAIAGIIDDHPRFAAQGDFLGLPVRSRSAMHAALDRGESLDAILLSTDTLQQVFWERTTSFRSRHIPARCVDGWTAN